MMLKSYTYMLLFAVFLAMAPAFRCSGSNLYCTAKNVEVVNGAIRLTRQWQPLLDEHFTNGLVAWKIENYENKLIIEVVDDAVSGGKCLRISNNSSNCDTAFEVASAALPVPADRSFRFRFAWRSTISSMMNNFVLSGHQGHYMAELEWLNAAGTCIAQTSFEFGKADDKWQTTCIDGKTPTNAASVVVRFGFDQPDIAKDKMIEIRNIGFLTRLEPPQFEGSGSLLSRPLHVALGSPRRLAWQADVPAGTKLRFQVSSAPDRDGAPDEWSQFAGPDGMPTSFFDASANLSAVHTGREWFRYCVTFATTNPAKTPSLQNVILNAVTDGPWSGPDTKPPVVTERSPTRTPDAAAPIWFRLEDDTGVDPGTLRVTFDDADITRQVILKDGRYVFTPLTPLKPRSAVSGFKGWLLENYNNELSITQAVQRTTEAPPGYHVTRATAETDTAFRLRSPPIPVVAGESYRLSYWSRHSLDLTRVVGKGGLFWLGEKDAVIGNPIPLPFGPADPEWHQHTCEVTVPPGALLAQIVFDVDNPNIFDGSFLDIAEVTFNGKMPTEDPRPNLHTIQVQAADFAGNEFTRTWYVLIRPLRTTNLVTIRDDGMTLIDGKPFFPIGLYAVWKGPFNNNSFDKAFGDLKAAGFNFAHTYNSTRGPDFTEFLAAAARHGIRLFISSGANANCLDLKMVLADMVKEEAEPAVISWYLADDTASHVGHEELRRLSEAIHEVDPSRVTVQADSVGEPAASRYTKFVNSTDGFLPEIYPIGDDTDKGVPKVIADMKTIAADLAKAGTRRKTIWSIIQYFQGWGYLRYPTREELWAMSYLSIIYGANGITWYTYQYGNVGNTSKDHGVTYSPEVWKNICDLAGELSKLQDALVEQTGTQPPAPAILSGPEKDALGNQSISVLLKQHAGKKYLLVANSAKAEVSARLSVFGATRINLPFENRQLSATGGAVTDTFAPYGVHVYTWE